MTVERRRDPAPPGSPVVQKARQPDDLTAIEGIGPAFEKALNALGIYLFADLARQNPEDLAARLTARVTADRIRRDQWIEQAQAKADEQA